MAYTSKNIYIKNPIFLKLKVASSSNHLLSTAHPLHLSFALTITRELGEKGGPSNRAILDHRGKSSLA